MQTIKQLKEERKRAFDAMTDIRSKLDAEERKDKTMTAEERQAWDAANADFDRLNGAIADAEKYQRAQSLVGQPDGNPDAVPGRHDRQADTGAVKPVTMAEYRMAVNGWARGQMTGEFGQREAAAMQRCGISANAKELRISLPGQYGPRTIAQARAMTVGTATEGAEFVPEDFVRNLEVALLSYGSMLQHVTTLRTDTGSDLPYPTMNDTSNAGAMVSENATAGTEAKPTTGNITFSAYKGSSKPVLVTQELIEDSAFDMAAVISDALGMRLGRLMNAQMTTGTGSSAPNGIVTAATNGRTATNATSITYADILNLFYSVDAAYRAMPGCAFMFNDQIAPSLRLIKDDAGQYIFHADMSAATGERLLGKPIVYNNDMASSIAASAVTMVCGDLSKYLLRLVRDIRVHRLSEYYRVSNDADGFVAFVRFDGDILDAGTHPIKKMTQASGS